MTRTMFKKTARYLTQRSGLKATATALVLAAATALTACGPVSFVRLPPADVGFAQPVYCPPNQPCPNPSAPPPQVGYPQGGGYRGGSPGAYPPGAYPPGGFPPGAQQHIIPPGLFQQQPPHILGNTYQQQAPNVLRPDMVPPGFPPFGGGGGYPGGGATILTPDPLQGQPRFQEGIDHSRQEAVICLFPYTLAQDVRNPSKIFCQHAASGAVREPFLRRMVSPAVDPYAPSNQISIFQGGYTGHCPPFQTPVYKTGDGTQITGGYEEPQCWNPQTGRFNPPIPTIPLQQQQYQQPYQRPPGY
ncbi:MAG: hypothetical protein WBK91_08275 [Alphaproteobacteria bacterium]